MLVLSRKLDEEILISGDIQIKVLKFAGNKVQLGITAPNEVRIERSEIYDCDSDQGNRELYQSKESCVRETQETSGGTNFGRF